MAPVSVQASGNSRVEGSGGVSNGEALEVDGGVLAGGVAVDDLLREGGHVMTAVRLGGDVQVVRAVLREARQELLDQRVVVLGGGGVIGLVVVAGLVAAVGKSDTAGSFDENHICNGVPRVRVQRQGHVLVGAKRALLSHETQQAGATRSTVGPKGNRVGGRSILGLNEPIMQVLRRGDGQVAGELAEVQVQFFRAGQILDLIGQCLGGVVGGDNRRTQQKGGQHKRQHTSRANLLCTSRSRRNHVEAASDTGIPPRHKSVMRHATRDI